MQSQISPWGQHPFHSLDFALRERFGEKVIKLSLDGRFSCPNRDGTVGHGGCLFCDETGSGQHAGDRNLSITAQIAQQRLLLRGKWRERKAIAYFQNFTNTYADVARLRDVYAEALAAPGIVGLALATRPDALPPAVIELLKELAQKTFLWVELGLQTIHPHSAAAMRRGYDLSVFSDSFFQLSAHGIRVVVHLILGWPGESRRDMEASVDFVAQCRPWGIKLHALHIHRETDLHRLFQQEPFEILKKEAYIELVADLLERLPPEIVVHRITGDASRARLVAPDWSLEKKRVYTGIIMEMHRRGALQGARFNRVSGNTF